MTFQEFSARAHEIFEGVPEEYREGVDGLEVSRKTVPHPELPEIFTLGECLSEFYPSDYGGAGEVRSRVVLYYGSFLQLARTHEDWDWEGELFETITHEIRHHLEHLARDDQLEEMDYAEDQNFARREGRSFDPFFFHAGRDLGDGIFEVDGDVFVERNARRRGGEEVVEFELRGRTWRVTVPPGSAAVRYVRVEEPDDADHDDDHDLYLVLVRKPGFLDLVRDFLGLQKLTVEEVEAAGGGAVPGEVE